MFFQKKRRAVCSHGTIDTMVKSFIYFIRSIPFLHTCLVSLIMISFLEDTIYLIAMLCLPVNAFTDSNKITLGGFHPYSPNLMFELFQ